MGRKATNPNTRGELWRILGAYKIILSVDADRTPEGRWVSVVQRVILTAEGAWYVQELRLGGVDFASRAAALRRAYRYLEQHHLRAREGWVTVSKPVNDESPNGLVGMPKAARGVHPGFLFANRRLPDPEDNRLERDFRSGDIGSPDQREVDEWFRGG